MSGRRSTRHRFKGKPQSRAVWMKGPHDSPEDTDASKARCTCWYCCKEVIAIISRQGEQPAGRRQKFHRDETGKITKITFEPVTFTRGAATCPNCGGLLLLLFTYTEDNPLDLGPGVIRPIGGIELAESGYALCSSYR